MKTIFREETSALPPGNAYLPDRPVVFVDLETTGGSAADDRITEIGLVEIGLGGVSRWSSLVSPGRAIPPFIQQLTGISNAMVRDAPSFDSLAASLAERLRGKLFVAHNMRFDYGFLKSAFLRVGIDFSVDALCTVRLSRALFPAERRHGLDAVVERLGLMPQGRHRALADADLLWQFWQRVHHMHPPALVAAEIARLTQTEALTPRLARDVLDAIPLAHGAYVFYDKSNAPLFVGKGARLKHRVFAHFRAERPNARQAALAQQVHRVEWRRSGGEVGALLLEAHWINALQPPHNRPVRARTICAWHLDGKAPATQPPALVFASALDFGAGHRLFGPFSSKRQADAKLREVARANQLCHASLGLDCPASSAASGPAAAGASCTAQACGRAQGGRCGAAGEGRALDAMPRHMPGREAALAQRVRLLDALADCAVQPWPYAGAIGIVERDTLDGEQTIHVIDNWRYRGSAPTRAAAIALLAAQASPAGFDWDTYKIVGRRLALGNLRLELLFDAVNPATDARTMTSTGAVASDEMKAVVSDVVNDAAANILDSDPGAASAPLGRRAG